MTYLALCMDHQLLVCLCALLPVIPGGIVNMMFVKLPLLKSWSAPMDSGLVLKDGERLFGKNKTWKGLAGMVVFTALCAVALRIYPKAGRAFQPEFDLAAIARYAFYGALLGAAYILAELPNSFFKRRLDVPPGGNIGGIAGLLLTILDQADSVIGGAIVIACFTQVTVAQFWLLVLVASAVHYAINVLLYLVRLKGQAR